MEASFGIAAAAQPALTPVGSGIAPDAYGVTVNFELANFSNTTLLYKSAEPIRGYMEHEGINVEPGKNMKFAARKAAASLYGSQGVALFEIATRLLFVYWQVPLTGAGGSNELGLGFSKPGQLKKDFYSDPWEVRKDDKFHKKLEAWDFAQYKDNVRFVKINDGDYAVRGTMGTGKQTTIKLELVPIRVAEFAPTLEKYTKH